MYEIVVVGSSAGGLDALYKLFSGLPANFKLPVAVVQHLAHAESDIFAKLLDEKVDIRVKEADSREQLKPGIIYIAPPDYHLLVEHDNTISLSVDDEVNFSRPSIDVLFESAVYAYGPAVIGIILSGANNDGAEGLKKIKQAGGLAVVQSPDTAYSKEMPLAAIRNTVIDYILEIEEISSLLCRISGERDGY